MIAYAALQSLFMCTRFLLVFMIIFPISLAFGGGTDLSVHDGWIREAPPNASVLAGYMVIENDGAKPRRLTGAESPAFGAIELHRSVVKNGIASMVPQSSIIIPPAGGQVAFEPDGYHLMMMEPAKPVRAGSDLTVFLTFDGGQRLQTRLPVRRGAGGERRHHH